LQLALEVSDPYNENNFARTADCEVSMTVDATTAHPATANPTTGLVEKELAGIAVKTVGWGLDRAYKWYQSYTLLIIGPARSGKSTLYRFLKLRLLATQGEDTRPTVAPNDSGLFSFEWKSEDGEVLLLQLRNVSDQSGHDGPFNHAKLFVRKKPHLVIVVLSAESFESPGDRGDRRWFELFCARVADLLRNSKKAKKTSDALRQMVILLNKVDLLDHGAGQEQQLAGYKSQIRDIIKDRLVYSFGTKAEHFDVLPCCMLRGANDTMATLRRVITSLVIATGMR
jgi:hypothetical protein